jgi:hypothetical protein
MKRGEIAETAPVFDDVFRARLADLFAWRRDVRRFKPDPVESSVIEALALCERRNTVRAGSGPCQFSSLQRGGAGLL